MENLKMWAIGNKNESEVCINFDTEEDDYELSFKHLLPTKKLAEQYVEDALGIDYFPFEVEVISYKNGISQFEYETPKEWKYDEDEEDYE